MGNKHLTSFADHLDEQYGERETKEREAYEQEFEIFKLEAEKLERPTATIDPALNEYTDKIMFTEKYERQKKSLEQLSCRQTKTISNNKVSN